MSKLNENLATYTMTVAVCFVSFEAVKDNNEERYFLIVNPNVKVFGNIGVIRQLSVFRNENKELKVAGSKFVVLNNNLTADIYLHKLDYTQFVGQTKIVKLTLTKDETLVDEEGKPWMSVSEIEVLSDLEIRTEKLTKIVNSKAKSTTVENKTNTSKSNKVITLGDLII